MSASKSTVQPTVKLQRHVVLKLLTADCIESCPVCLDNFNLHTDLESVYMTGCGHYFCGKCIGQLSECAICREPIRRISDKTLLPLLSPMPPIPVQTHQPTQPLDTVWNRDDIIAVDSDHMDPDDYAAPVVKGLDSCGWKFISVKFRLTPSDAMVAQGYSVRNIAQTFEENPENWWRWSACSATILPPFLPGNLRDDEQQLIVQVIAGHAVRLSYWATPNEYMGYTCELDCDPMSFFG